MYGFRRLEREWPFDLLEVEESFGTARWIARAVNAKVIVRLHGPWIVNGTALGVPRDTEFYARVTAEGRAIATAAAVSAPSHKVIEHVRDYYNIKLPNAVVVPNPGPEPTSAHNWDRESAESGHVVFVGRFDRHKGGDIAVDAFSLLAERIPSLKLTMAGPDRGVIDESGRHWSFREYVAAKVPGSHRGRIEFIGQVSNDALVKLRRRASVVISAARFENFPMAVLEALSQGCPVVCPDAGGLPEMVEDGVSGLVYPSGDAAALARRIESIIQAPALAAELGATALQQYRSKYLPQRVAERTIEFYQNVCEQHPARRRGGL
jgi:glycosyltransferase involved in cell wall biosynthesis